MPSSQGEDWRQKFGDETGIHGVSPLLRSKSHIEKIVWLFIVLAAFGMVVAGVAKTIVEYIHQPVATKMTLASMTKFPSIMVCTPYWVNETRARNLGMTYEDYRHAGWLTLTPQVFAWDLNKESDKQKYNESLGKFLDKFGDYQIDDVLQQISHDFTNGGIPAWDTVSYASFKQAQVFTGTGAPCTRLESFLEFQAIMGGEQEVIVQLQQVKYAFGFKSVWKPVPTIFIGGDALSAFPFGSTRVGYGKITAVQIKPTRLRLHPKREGSCNSHPTSSEFTSCIIDALSSFCPQHGGGLLTTARHNLTVRDVASKRFDASPECDVERKNEHGKTMLDEIKGRCPQPCDQWLYQVGATTIGETDDSTTVITIRTNDPEHCLSFEEFFPTTPQGFISNLGGQISLYTGASLVTIIHVFIFCFFTRK